jgi:L-threonylcarbamoyladenylate synthase
MAECGTDIQTAAQFLREGNCVAIPTETVYGLAANAFNEKAVSDIFRIKNRPEFDPLIVHTGSIDSARLLVREIPPIAEELMRKFWPGPLTLVLPKSTRIPDAVSSGLQTVGIRIPDHPLTLELLNILEFPLAAPSANPFGYVSPTRAEHVATTLGNAIPYILDGGDCSRGIESTIVGFESGKPVLYRYGSLSVQEIEELTGPLEIRINQSSNPVAPGQVKVHYSPHKPVRTGNPIAGKKAGMIRFKEYAADYDTSFQKILSPEGDLYIAARRLYGFLRDWDDSDVDEILVEWVPEGGIGNAINDRLRRACAKG